jgi:hypothetical protein
LDRSTILRRRLRECIDGATDRPFFRIALKARGSRFRPHKPHSRNCLNCLPSRYNATRTAKILDCASTIPATNAIAEITAAIRTPIR